MKKEGAKWKGEHGRVESELQALKDKYDLEEIEEKMKIQGLKEDKFKKLIEKLDSINVSGRGNRVGIVGE